MRSTTDAPEAARRPLSVAGNGALDRTCVRAADSLPQAQARLGPQGDRSAPALAGAASRIQSLPPELLCQIFDYLALSVQSQCALVCRHWYAALPPWRCAIARWLECHPLPPRVRHAHLLPGLNDRSVPFLAHSRHRCYRLLQQQHQELQRLQAALPMAVGSQRPGPVHSAQGWSAGLVHYNLHQHLTAADQLRLAPLSLDWPDARCHAGSAFSPCSRWLMTGYHPPEAGRDPSPQVLLLYGWNNERWHRQTLQPQAAARATCANFCTTPADTLVTAVDREIAVWRWERGTACWHGRSLYRAGPQATVENLGAMSNGDLVALFGNAQGASWVSLLFFRYRAREQDWQPPEQHLYMARQSSVASDTRSCRMHLSFSGWNPTSWHYTNVLYLWRHQADACSQGRWSSQVFTLPWHSGYIRKTAYSPGGQHLLTLLSDGRLCIWGFDARQRLQERLTVADCRHPALPRLNQLVACRDDGRQLVVAQSLRRLQFCDRKSDGQWQLGETVNTPAAAGDRLDDSLRALLLSSSGRTLVRLTTQAVDIWHKDSAGHWHRQVQCKAEEEGVTPPCACLQGLGDLVCISTGPPDNSLWIYGPDSEGRLVRKACLAIERPGVRFLISSPDGLSILLGGAPLPPALVQLTGLDAAVTSGPLAR